jgi:hypothetical protein
VSRRLQQRKRRETVTLTDKSDIADGENANVSIHVEPWRSTLLLLLDYAIIEASYRRLHNLIRLLELARNELEDLGSGKKASNGIRSH